MESVPEPTKVEVVEAKPTTDGPRLFGEGPVALASLVGTPVAGGLLLGANGLRAGQRVGALAGVAVGGLATFTLLGLMPYLPAGVPVWVMFPIGAVVMWWVTRILQGDLLTRRRPGGSGGQLAVALVVGGVTLGALYFAARPYLVRKGAVVPVSVMTVADKQTVNYIAPVTEEEARRVGAALLEVKYFDQSGVAKNVYMAGDEQGHTIIIFPGDPARAQEPQAIRSMAVLAQQFARAGVRIPFTIRLVGPDGKTLNEAKAQVTPATTHAAPTTREGLQQPFGSP